MSRSQIDGIGLLLAVAAAVLILRLCSQGPFDWIGSIAGLALVFVLLGFDREGYRSTFESLAFAAVLGLSMTVAATAVLRILAGSVQQPAPLEGRITNEWMPLIWGLVTLIFWPIDRARMSGRVAPVPSSATFQFSPAPLPSPPAEVPHAARRDVYPASPTPAPRTSRAAFTQPTFSQPEPEPEPPVFTPQPVQPPSVVAPPPPSTPVRQPVPSTPPPQAVPVPPGKEATIYVTLVGEGLNVLRAVRAEHLGRDYYKIVEEMPEGETWQYGPGQVVRCKKKNLSSGKAMVAYEEAQRAQ